MKNVKWYRDWFNSPYYHILYKHRDEQDAQALIKNLVYKLKPAASEQILDLACGKGRHAIFLNKLGYNVIGIDLSEASIKYAQQFENQTLHFEQGDMRTPFGENRFRYIFNLFTSFGYFQTLEEHQEAIDRMAEALTDNGTLVLDFLNVNKLLAQLVQEEVIHVDGVDFTISRTIKNNKVVKSIAFTDKGECYKFQENVQLFTLADFKAMFSRAKLKLVSVYGDFHLNAFDENSSERLILFAQPI